MIHCVVPAKALICLNQSPCPFDPSGHLVRLGRRAIWSERQHPVIALHRADADCDTRSLRLLNFESPGVCKRTVGCGNRRYDCRSRPAKIRHPINQTLWPVTGPTTSGFGEEMLRPRVNADPAGSRADARLSGGASGRSHYLNSTARGSVGSGSVIAAEGRPRIWDGTSSLDPRSLHR